MAFAETEESRMEIREKALDAVGKLLDRVPSLRASTAAVLKTMHRVRAKLDDHGSGYCVNWADLGPVEVGVKVSSDGIRLFVLIEEASPEAHEFCREVERRLQANYCFPGVEVSTEW